MDEVRNVLVTVCLSFENKKIDMELPAFLPVEQLCSKMLESLRILDPENYETAEDVFLLWKGRRLEKQETLAYSGIWDGSYVELMAVGGGAE